MQTHFTTLCLWWLLSRCFPNPCQSDNWWLTTARRNCPYLPVTVPSWRRGFLSWHVDRSIENVSITYRICILRTSLSGWSFRFMICKLWSHCSHYKHDLHDYCGALWWVPRPLFPWGDKVIDHDTNIYIEWHNIIHGNRKERQSLLLRGIGSGPGPSPPPFCFISWHGD